MIRNLSQKTKIPILSKRDLQLLVDLARSFLRQQGLLKRKPILFWHYKTRQGIEFKLRRDVWDSAVVIETWWLNEYLRNLKKIQEGATVIDVGAHIGSFSIFIASNLKDVKVLAFEPGPDNFILLKENIKINHLENKVLPFKFALAKKGGEKIKFNVHPDNLGMCSSVLSYKNLRKEKKDIFFEAKTISLKQVFEKNQLSKCDLLKMDCEGCEYPVLLSTPEDVLKKIRNLTLEYHRGGDIQKVKQYLEHTGFKTKFDRAIPNRAIGWMVNAPLLNAWREK